jgi:hypothetical protein
MAAAAELADAELRWRSYIVPEAARLQTVLDGRTRSVEVLSAENARQVERSRRQSDLGATLGSDARQFAAGLASYRDYLELNKRQVPNHVRGPAYSVRHATLGHGHPAVGHDTGSGP